MNVAGVRHIDCQNSQLRLTCKRCILELTIYVPNQHSIDEYMKITEPFLTNQLKAITKQKNNTYILTTHSGETLENLKFKLTYLCELNITKLEQTVPQLRPKQCPDYKNIGEDKLEIKTVIYKKTSTSQEIKLPKHLTISV